VREVYYPEVEALLKRRTGAARVVIFDHVVRNADKARRKEDNAREYGKAVHNDYSLKSAPRRVLDHVPEDAGELLQHRFAEINVWRAIRGPVQVHAAGRMRWRAVSKPTTWWPATWSIPIVSVRLTRSPYNPNHHHN